MKIMVAYDGTLQAKEALAYGIEKARVKGGEVVALHVFDSSAMADYDATPNARNEARAEAGRFIDEAKAIIAGAAKGVPASLYSTEGDPEQQVIDFAKSEKVDVLLCPPKFRSVIGNYRQFVELESETAKMQVASLAVSKKSM